MFIHNLDPFAIEFTWGPLVSLFGENFGIRWYGLSYLSGFIASYFLIIEMAKRNKSFLKTSQVADYITYAAIGVMIGGRVGYCLFYDLSLLTKFTSSFPFWGVLEVHKGGMASHGGMIGPIFAAMLFATKNKVSKFHLVDLLALCGGIGIFFGRLANYINGELFGRIAPESFKYAVKFPNEMFLWTSTNIEKLKELAPTVSLLEKINLGHSSVTLNTEVWNSWVSKAEFGGASLGSINMVLHKLITEIQLGNAKIIESIGPVLNPRYPSQLYQAAMEGFLAFAITAFYWRKKRKPGVPGVIFGVTYAVMRIIGEQFRMPDAHIGFDILGLTRGQWLSFAMIAIVLIYLYFILKTKTEKI